MFALEGSLEPEGLSVMIDSRLSMLILISTVSDRMSLKAFKMTLQSGQVLPMLRTRTLCSNKTTRGNLCETKKNVSLNTWHNHPN